MEFLPQYLSEEKPCRRTFRLKGYDYTQEGAYFITICCYNKKCWFGNIVGATLAVARHDDVITQLNEYGIIAFNEWNNLSQRFSNFESDVFQIMPNHMHGIIVLNESVWATLAVARDNGERAGASPAPTIGEIVGAYKSLVANRCLELFKLKWTGENQREGAVGATPAVARERVTCNHRAGASPAPTMGKLWQRNYYEHIIRNEQSYQAISDYIINNPAKWQDDKFYIKS